MDSLGWGPVAPPKCYPLSDLSAVQRPVPQNSLRNYAAKDAFSVISSPYESTSSPPQRRAGGLPSMAKRFVTPSKQDMERGMDWSATDYWVSSLRSSANNSRPSSPDRPHSPSSRASPEPRPESRARSPTRAKTPSIRKSLSASETEEEDGRVEPLAPLSHRSSSAASFSEEPVPLPPIVTVASEPSPPADPAPASPTAEQEPATADDADPEPIEPVAEAAAAPEPVPGLERSKTVGVAGGKAKPFDDLASFRQRGRTATRINSIMIRAGGIIEELNTDYSLDDGSTELVEIGREGGKSADLLSVAVYEHIYKITGKFDKKRGLCALQFHIVQKDLDQRKSAFYGSQFGEPFAIEAPAGQCVLGFHGSVDPERGVMSLGAYFGPITHAMEADEPADDE